MSELQLTMFAPKSEWRPPKIEDLPPSWADIEYVGIDTETKDEQLKQLGPGDVRPDSFFVGVSFAFEDGTKHYLPIRHHGGDNMDEEAVLDYLRDRAKEFRGEVVGANLSYDLGFLMKEGIIFHESVRFRDIQVAEALINEHRMRYSLNSIAQERLGLEKKEELLDIAAKEFKLKNPKGEMWKLPARYVGPYAEEDAELPLKIYREQLKDIEKDQLWGVFNLETDVLPVLVKMHRRGVRIDVQKLEEIEAFCLNVEKESLKEVGQKTGIHIAPGDVWKAAALVPALEYLGVDIPKTPTGKPSIKKEILDNVEHPVADHLKKAREYNKIRTTFCKSIRTHMVNGRVHCSFNQLARDNDDGGVKGAKYGRLSAEHPNMQQQPARHPVLGKMWRSIYVPDVGGEWACLDYSQQEPRMTVHFAEMCKLPKAKEAADKYRNDPKTDNHQMMADLAGISRKAAKNIFLGLCYGMGGAKLAHDLGLPTKWINRSNGRMLEVAGEEAQDLLDKFDLEVPFVRKLSKRCQDTANQRGYITTLSGRRCRFPLLEDGSRDWAHKALNRLIQGSSADQTKMAMVAADKAGFQVQLQVHDELDLTIYDRKEAEELADIMMTCVTLKVPSRVDIEIGPNWGEIDEV